MQLKLSYYCCSHPSGRPGGVSRGGARDSTLQYHMCCPKEFLKRWKVCSF